MDQAVGAWCRGAELCFRLQDTDQRLSGVRLGSGVFARGADLSFDYLPDAHSSKSSSRDLILSFLGRSKCVSVSLNLCSVSV
ncbi:hypothetical protein AB0M20_19540, partial [Actinoplanes sp. NPDC051633]|uniref:hypothetical protein n=1 Tax=Actinoplanes sp. NPDC051633 TaxID=3155670 RepID=UPI003446F126